MTLPPPASLRAAAYGLYPLQAATGPVIAHGTRLAREDSAPLHPPRHRTAAIDWEAAISTPDAGGLPSPGGEQRMLRLAASLAGRAPASLGGEQSPASTNATPACWSRQSFTPPDDASSPLLRTLLD